ncbi:MAG: hypothetical protein BGO43_12530 [Gammaproteobacteria bacterium 39-13]|nr:ferredoxin--NADP reductase [Gammaproteobacteria bacterium]OJV89974.1 MAG: hypothetical protein BGO43_12530 [Gammaproteobacteria bacterium 39-13]
MKWVEGKICGQHEWAPGLYSLFVQASILPFEAGQFIQISLDAPTYKLFRPYSLVNAPDDPTLEFYYTLVKAGELTPFLPQLSIGDSIGIAERAHGRFVLSDVPEAKILWLIATGTGLGPFLSLLKTKEPWSRFEKIVLVHSVRYSNELTHQALIEMWQEQYPQQFLWVPLVTRENAVHAHRERVTTLLLSGNLEALTQLTLSALTSQVMLCGNPEMIDEVVALLLKRGLTINRIKQKGQITLENYWK